jgi:hypothetical protein
MTQRAAKPPRAVPARRAAWFNAHQRRRSRPIRPRLPGAHHAHEGLLGLGGDSRQQRDPDSEGCRGPQPGRALHQEHKRPGHSGADQTSPTGPPPPPYPCCGKRSHKEHERPARSQRRRRGVHRQLRPARRCAERRQRARWRVLVGCCSALRAQDRDDSQPLAAARDVQCSTTVSSFLRYERTLRARPMAAPSPAA